NGRNNIVRAYSDYDPGHRISAYISKRFSYLNDMMATTVSLVYNGQSGNRFSYVMNRGMVRDLDNNETNDLIYVPTTSELNSIIFLQNGSETPADQRAAFDAYIENDKYLSS